MKNLLALVAAVVLAAPAAAQSQDLGGVGQAISKLALAARGGTACSLDLTVHGVLYVPYPAFHSADGAFEYGALGLGADLSKGVTGTKLHGAPLILPLANAGGVLHLLTGSNWSKSHLTFTDIGNVSAGVGVLPLPVPGSHGKWVVGSQVEGVVTFGFGKGA